MQKDEDHGQSRSRQGREQILEIGQLALFFREHLGQDNNKDHLGDLGRLQIEETDLDPPHRPLIRLSDHQDQAQQKQAGDIKIDRPIFQIYIVDKSEQQHQDQSDPDKEQLALDKMKGIGDALEAVRSAIKGQRPGGLERKYRQQKEDVKIPNQPAI